MSTLDTIAEKIIKEQELVIGPLAWTEAKKVLGISIDQQAGTAAVGNSDPKVVDQLVGRYERLFGRASHEVCREAVASLVATMAPAEVPSSLR